MQFTKAPGIRDVQWDTISRSVKLTLDFDESAWRAAQSGKSEWYHIVPEGGSGATALEVGTADGFIYGLHIGAKRYRANAAPTSAKAVAAQAAATVAAQAAQIAALSGQVTELLAMLKSTNNPNKPIQRK